MNDYIKVFHKGSAAAKKKLKLDHPEEYKEIEQVRNLRNKHMCCYQEDCIHPACKEGTLNDKIFWYPGGPPITFLPIPVKDPERCFGSKNCKDCSRNCTGHYMKIDKLIDYNKKGDKQGETRPPSEEISKELVKNKYILTDEEKMELAHKVLLSTEEIDMLVDHLKTVHENRKKAAQKRKTSKTTSKSNPKKIPAKMAKEKNRKDTEKENQVDERCSMCGMKEPDDVDEDILDWICCDCCTSWFHMACVGLTRKDASDYWICTICCYN